MPSSRPSLTEVATAAGVSVATVSRALRGRGELSPETRTRVLQTAERLGYTRSGTPRGRPRGGTSRIFDLVLGHFHDPYTDEVVAGAHTAASRLSYDLVLTAERDDPGDDWPARIRSRGSAGVVLGLILPTAAQLEVVQGAGIPVVLLEPPSGTTQHVPSVRNTDHAGGSAAAEHLLAQGARRFIVIGGAPSYRYGRARIEGFLSTLDETAPAAPRILTTADWGAADARRACAAALDDLGGEGPIGLFACSDEMAAGAYRAIAEAGLAVGRHVLVVGYDDVRGARWLHPPLTTIRQPIREMAAAAVTLLAQMAGGAQLADEVVELPTVLVARGSTGRPR
ncbi:MULTISPECIES: LacI family DNA-binding transcriptional regulator [Microbacterium]|uniref:LacI family DNA-binding transcriptional regulator n=1 Tax=Microbacterium TaxID=33882 RepID=UPI00249EC098|nr:MULTISPECIES: LacI family DNA-binding transcriptional regulator [Microbacterium]WHE35315.1 LacI family DNA-binding transcriptional regulator [Microbacterium sp. BDGP8]WRK16412.1 LacI family DNA-binding transcriptional regulator [Microbacterium plantarum]